MSDALVSPSGGTRPPVMVIVLATSFMLLMAALLIGSFTTPEFPPYTPSAAVPVPVGDTLVGPVTYTVQRGQSHLPEAHFTPFYAIASISARSAMAEIPIPVSTTQSLTVNSGIKLRSF